MKTIVKALMVVGGLLAFGSAALASGSAGVLRVDDRAGAFTPEGVKQAERLFADTQFKSVTHFTVVTVTAKDVPASLKSDLKDAMEKHDAAAANRVFTDWARELAKSEREKGVFVLAFLQGEQHWIKVVVDRQTDVARHFSDADAKKITDLLVDGFKKAKGKAGEEAQASRDVALIAATNDVIAELKNTSAPEPKTPIRHTNDGHRSSGGGMSIGGWICLLLVVGLGVWLVVGLIRTFSSYGYYPGYGYGYGPYYGGGFFSGFMGGMFGAAAGMWLYDSFTGGHHYTNDLAASDSAGSYDDGGAGDFDNGADAGGGDWGGDDGGGGDFGDAGGGDWGGGGGDFGGGDFGGGDFGGGDW